MAKLKPKGRKQAALVEPAARGMMMIMTEEEEQAGDEIVMQPVTPQPGEARPGMASLLARWRRMVDDVAGAVWSDLEAQELLDVGRTEWLALPLLAQVQIVDGATVYVLYTTNGVVDLESAATADAWRIYDGAGVEFPAGNVDYLRGLISFDEDTGGVGLYLDCRSYDLPAAAAAGWRERMASKASSYDFEADGARYTRSQWFAHCQQMAAHFDAQRRGGTITMARSDVW